MKLLLNRGDVEKGCPTIGDESIDVSVLSPPYYKRDRWSRRHMRLLGELLARVLKPGGRAFMVFGPIQEGLLRPFESAQLVGKADGLTPWQTITWVKSIAIDKTTYGHFQPISSKQLVNYTHEYVFQFVKGAPKEAPPLDRLSVGVPYMDKSNLKRGTRGKNGDIRCAGDTWFIPYSTTGPSKKKAHRHSFPLRLAKRCIKLSGVPEGSWIFDPYSGGGTTALAAFLLGMNAVANDIDPHALKTTRANWIKRGGEILSE